MRFSVRNTAFLAKATPSGGADTTLATWLATVAGAGGAAPSAGTQAALSTFLAALNTAGIRSKMKAVNCMVPDNLTACTTPLISTYGNSVWTNHQFLAADLSVNGLVPNDGNCYLETGLNPFTAFSTMNSGGISLYSTLSHTATLADCAAFGASSSGFQLLTGYGAECYFDCFNGGTGRINGAGLANSMGFTSGNRIASNDIKIYTANSAVAFNTTVQGTGSPGSVRPNQPMYLFAWNNNGSAGSFTKKRFSFCAIHEGLTSTEAQALYNAVQAMRTSLGGGYV